MPRNTENLLTETELEMMNILWDIGGGTVREVLAKLPEDRTLAYTSASTMIRILEQKGCVRSKKSGKAHIYIPILKREEYGGRTLNHVIENVFNGASAALVRQLVTDTHLTKEEKDEIKRIIDEEL